MWCSHRYSLGIPAMSSAFNAGGTFSARAINGKIYAVGGRIGNFVVLAAVEEYDPKIDT